jgi:angiopoietin 2
MTRGGWTVVQRQFHGDVDFNRNYKDYTKGFGSVSGDHWLGLDKMHALTTILGNTSSLRIDFELYTGEGGYQLYADVSVDTSVSGYKLHVTGTPQDLSTLAVPKAPTSSYGYEYGLHWNKGRQFSTIDHDVDGHGCPSSAYSSGGGGWWFNWCSMVNVNARYGQQSSGGITMSGGEGGNYVTNPMMSVRRNYIYSLSVCHFCMSVCHSCQSACLPCLYVCPS